MSKNEGTRVKSPYDLNASLKYRKSSETKASTAPKSPYTLSARSSLHAAVALAKKR